MSRLTAAQIIGLADLVRRYNNAAVELSFEPFALPSGWVAFTLTEKLNDVALVGGVSPEGEVST